MSRKKPIYSFIADTFLFRLWSDTYFYKFYKWKVGKSQNIVSTFRTMCEKSTYNIIMCAKLNE